MTIGGGFDMSATLMESKVKSAESTLAFVQEEHRKTLAGLHKEIQDLQLKCSDLQLSVVTLRSASSQDAREHAKEVESFVEKLRSAQEDKCAMERAWTDHMNQKDKRISELEEQARLQADHLKSVELENQELRNQIKVSSEVGKLQRECTKIYQEKSEQVGDKLLSISSKARGGDTSTLPDPEIRRKSRTAHGRMEMEQHSSSLGSGLAPVKPIRKVSHIPTPELTRQQQSLISDRSIKWEENRSKVFRHKLQSDSLRNHWYPQFGVAVEKLAGASDSRPPRQSLDSQSSTCDSSSNPLSGPYSFQNPPCSLESRVNGALRKSSSSLPPIGLNNLEEWRETSNSHHKPDSGTVVLGKLALREGDILIKKSKNVNKPTET